MSTFESMDVTLDKAIEPDEKTVESIKPFDDPTFIGSAHSPIYDEIRAIPSSNYYKTKHDSTGMLGKS